jgi:predicted MFS family arabinose efflux permease
MPASHPTPARANLLRSRRYGWYVLTLFASMNFFNYANRNIVLPMYDDLRSVFGFSNAELGLLTTSFMGFHALVAIPAGWAADRFDRRMVIAAGLAVWSVGTMACAAAAGTYSMMLGRAIAGLGTGALVPVANALLCDVFPDEEKARTVSIFNIGLFLGGAAGFAIGAVFGYPLGVIIVALPPVALSFLAARVDVPARRASVSYSHERMTWHAFAIDCASILRIRSLRWLLLGAICISFANGGYLAWFVDFVARTKGLTVGGATLFFGASALSGGLAGVVAGGVVGDWLYRKVPYGRMAAISIGLSCAVPFALISIYVDGGVLFYAGAWLMMFFITWYHGPMAAAVDDLVADERAATAQAGLICLMHLLGTAPSAYVIGLVADRVGLRTALLVPTIAVGLAALAFTGAWRHVDLDQRAAGGAQ